MLCQFAFENFRSFKNEGFLDLCAESISEHKERLIEDVDGEKFLPLISIFGPNGGGKTTVLNAFMYLRQIITNPVFMIAQTRDDSSKEEQTAINQLIQLDSNSKHYKFDKDSENQPIKFSIMFRHNGYEYQYEIQRIKEKIIEENLYYKSIETNIATLVFERTQESCVLGEDIETIMVENVSDKLPLLSYITSVYNIEIVDNAMSWFLSTNILNYDNPIYDNRVVIPKDPEQRKNFFNVLSQMDIDITDIRIEKDSTGKIKEIYTKHSNEQGEFELTLEEESSGTRKIFSCLSTILKSLHKGSVLIADELDAKLHPKLFGFILQMFTNKELNKNGAQLIVTSHDMINLGAEIFRRDEILFCAMNSNNISNLYSLLDFKNEKGETPRKDAKYAKQYLEGKYGADPYIKKVFDWGE